MTSFQSLYAADARIAAGEVVSVQGVVFVRADGRAAAGAPKPAKPGDHLYANDIVNTSSNGSIKLLLKDKSIIDLGPSALFKLDKFDPGTGSDRKVEMNMMYGTLRGAVTQKLTGSGKFHLKTATATMGVRGTEFVVKTEVKSLEEVRHAVKNPGTSYAASVSQGQENGTANGLNKNASAKGDSTPAAKTEITVIQGKVDVAQKPAMNAGGAGASKEVPKVMSLTAGQQVTTSAVVSTGMPATTPKVVNLDTQQVGQIASNAKVADNTFKSAVMIDTPSDKGRGPAGDSGAGFGGAATMAALTTAIEAPSVVPTVTAGDIGIAGTFGGASIPTGVMPMNAANMLRHIKIVVVTQ